MIFKKNFKISPAVAVDVSVVLIEVGLNISAGSTGSAFNSSRPVTLTKAITISSTNFKKIVYEGTEVTKFWS